jgi:hypothetical protein
MNQFAPGSEFLRIRLRGTRYEDVEEFRALLKLEQLVLRPIRNWRDEALFIGLRDRFPAETEILIGEFEFGDTPLDDQTAAVPRQSKPELLRLREKRRIERRDFYRRERAEWFAAGGLP